MPTLNQLAPEMENALGKTLRSQYQVLLKKSKDESLRDNQEAIMYLDSVIKRYKTIEATSPSEVRRKPFLDQLQKHAEDVAVVSFSKPGDAATRLKAIDFSADSIDAITKGMEQPGVNDGDLVSAITSVVTSETLLASCSSHTHTHPFSH